MMVKRRTKRPVGSLPPSKPHRPGAWSANEKVPGTQIPGLRTKRFLEPRFPTSWREQNGVGDAVLSEEALLACIRQDSRLPNAEQRRFTRLRRKQQVLIRSIHEADYNPFSQGLGIPTHGRNRRIVNLAIFQP